MSHTHSSHHRSGAERARRNARNAARRAAVRRRKNLIHGLTLVTLGVFLIVAGWHPADLAFFATTVITEVS